MALQKTIIPLPIDLGLNTKVDPKQEDIGYLTVAENVVYETLKLLKKRNGYDLVSLQTLDNSELENVLKLSKYKKELLALGSGYLEALSESTMKWVNRGVIYPSNLNSKVILRNSSNQENSSGYVVENFEIYAWEDSRGGLRYSVLDNANKSFLVSDALLSSSGARPVVCNIQNTVYIFYADGTDLKFKKFVTASPGVLSSATVAKNDINADENLHDCIAIQNNIFCVYNSTTDEVGLFRVNSSDAVSSTISFPGEPASHALTISTDAQFRVIFAWSSGTTAKYAIYPSNLAAALLSPTTISTETTNITNITLAQNESATYTVFWEVSAAQSSNYFIKRARLSLAGAITNVEANFLRSVGLASKAFMHNDVVFVSVVHDSELQPTNFVIDENAYFVTKFNNQNSIGLIESGVLNRVFSINGTSILIPTQTRGRLFSNDNAFYSLNGVNSVTLNFDPINKFQNKFLADNLHICSGVLKMYDGKSVSEHGFHVFPEAISQVSPIDAAVEITVEGQAGVSEVQKLLFNKVPTSGTYALQIGANTTSLISYAATTATIKSALEALPNVTTVTVTGTLAAGYDITFNAPIENIPLISIVTNTLRTNAVSVTTATTVEGVVGVKDVQRLDFSTVPDAGNYTLTIGAETTASLAFNASNATIKTELEALIAITTVTVTGNYTAGIVITFDDPIEDIDQITVTHNLTTGGNAVTVYPSVTTEGIAEVKELQTITFSEVPTAGTYTITVNAQTTAAIAYNANNAAIKAALEALASLTTVTVTGDYSAGLTVQYDNPVLSGQATVTSSLTGAVGEAIVVTPSVVTEGVAEVSQVQTLNFDSVPTSGSFTITIGAETTTAINYSMSAADVQAALLALTAVVDATVSGNFSAGFTITFLDPDIGFPEITISNNNLSNVVIANGAINDGNRAYVALYKWTDNTGKDHFSAPTLKALEVNFNSGTDTQGAMIRVPTLRLTEKEDVVLELYRTEADGTTFYKVTTDLNPIFNNKTVDYIDIPDTLSDTELITRELLYTTGNVIENISFPACSLIAVYGDRLAIVGEEENTVLFSKLVSEGRPVEPTDLIQKYFAPVGGKITAIAEAQAAFVAFQSDACHYLNGTGPNNTLQQDDFTSIELVASDIGCTDVDSVVLTPGGLMFKSRKGIYNLAIGSAPMYIGDKIEAYNSSTITSAEVVGELNQIRFTTSEEIALVYNYNLNRWATFTNHGARSSVVIENDYYYLREDGDIYKENRTLFSDASSPIKMRVQTGWLSFNNLQGFQRVYNAFILGNYKSEHKLIVKIAHNFIEAFQEQVTVNVLDFIDNTPYGGYSPYGAPSTVPYGGDRAKSLYQMRIDFEQQKSQSIKIQIEDAQDEVGEGLSLSGITLRVGAKAGGFAMAEDNKFGSE